MRDARLLAVTGAVYAVAIVVGTLLAFPTGLSEHAMEWRPVSEWLPGLVEAKVFFVAAMWVFHVTSVATIVFGVAWGGRLAVPFLAVSGGAFLVETTMILAMGLGIAPRYVAATGAELVALDGLATALVTFRVHMALVGSLALSAGAWVVGAQAWNLRGFPRPLAALALVAGALGVLGGASLAIEPFSHVRTAGVIAWALFNGLVAAHLWRARSAARATQA